MCHGPISPHALVRRKEESDERGGVQRTTRRERIRLSYLILSAEREKLKERRCSAPRSPHLRADSLSASEYESGFRAGEREPLRTSRARARAFFRGVFYTPSVNVTRTLHVRNNARNNFATTSSLRSCGPELSGERFFAPTTIPICHLPETLLALAASSFVLFVCGTAVTVQVGRVLWPGTLGRCLVRRALRARLLGGVWVLGQPG